MVKLNVKELFEVSKVLNKITRNHDSGINDDKLLLAKYINYINKCCYPIKEESSRLMEAMTRGKDSIDTRYNKLIKELEFRELEVMELDMQLLKDYHFDIADTIKLFMLEKEGEE